MENPYVPNYRIFPPRGPNVPYGLTEDGMLRQWAHRITAGQQPYPVEPGAEPYANEDGKFRVAVERIKKGVEK